jgi:hypothetical protein
MQKRLESPFVVLLVMLAGVRRRRRGSRSINVA